MDQESKQRPEGNDACYDQYFPEFPDGYRTQNFAAELKFQSHRHTLREIETGVWAAFDIIVNAVQAGVNNDDNADKFKQQDRIVDDRIQDRV